MTMLGDKTVNHRVRARRLLLHSLLAGTFAVGMGGCSSPSGFSFASMNPFSRGVSPTMNDPAAGPSLTTSIAAVDESPSAISSIGTSAKTAVSKSTNAVKGMFASSRTRKDDSGTSPDTDPLSLKNKPDQVGPDVFVAQGRLWESTGNSKKAMESFTKALEAEPGNAAALASIARLHFRNGEHTQAAEYFGRAIQSAPEDAGLYNDLGLTLSKIGNHGAAAETLGRALQLAPGTSRYVNNLASVLYDGGQTESAYSVLQKNNKPAVAHFNMAYLYQKNGQTEQARSHLNEAMKFEAQAVGDSAVSRAVSRSREMLAQMDGKPASNVAQATPQARTAALPKREDDKSGLEVRQASQSVPAAGVSYTTPSAGLTPPPGQTTIAPPSVQGAATYGVTPVTPLTGTVATPSQPAPTSQTPASTMPATTTAPSSSSGGFALPPGFAP